MGADFLAGTFERLSWLGSLLVPFSYLSDLLARYLIENCALKVVHCRSRIPVLQFSCNTERSRREFGSAASLM